MSDEAFRKRLGELIANTPKELVADTYARTLANIVDRAAYEAVYPEFVPPACKHWAWTEGRCMNCGKTVAELIGVTPVGLLGDTDGTQDPT